MAESARRRPPLSTRESIVSGYVGIAKILDLPEKDNSDQGVTASAIKSYLESAGGHVIVTSRAARFDVIGVTKPIEMDNMLPEEARDFLINRTGRDGIDGRAGIDGDELGAVDDLARELDYLPLALEQAGAFIIENESRFVDYIEAYRSAGAGLALLEEAMPVSGGLPYPAPVSTTWEMNFRAVEAASPAAADILRVCAFSDGDAVPLEIFSEVAAELGF